MPGLMDAIQYIGGSLDKPGRAVRGLLAGKPKEGLAALPFSDTLGITNPSESASGRELLNRWGATNPNDQGWGAWGAGLGTEMALDPLALFGTAKAGVKGLGSLSRAMKPSITNPVHHLAGLLGDTAAASRASRSLSPFESAMWMKENRRGALGLKYDDVVGSMLKDNRTIGQHFTALDAGHPPDYMGLIRSDPEWVNQRTFYHGSGTPGLTADKLDPRKTSAINLFGRGIYTTANDSIGRSYLGKGVSSSRLGAHDYFNNPELADRAFQMASSGGLDDFLRRHGGNFSPVRPTVRAPIEWSPSTKASELLRLAKGHATQDPWLMQQGLLGQHTEEALRLLAPDYVLPKETLYQAQGNFGKILDLDEAMRPSDYQNLHDVLHETFMNYPVHPRAPRPEDVFRRKVPFAGLEPGAGILDPKKLVKRGMTNESHFDEVDMPLLRGLRTAGYDAMTHTGGNMAGGGQTLHQVLIALDPNDMLGLGRKTPYQQWEPFR